jgi:drug/metabolite transporter (DMT)-like permease
VALIQDLSFVFEQSMPYIVSLAYLAVFGSIVGFGTYLTLLGRIGASVAGYAMVMFPVVAIGVSILTGEISPTWNALAGITGATSCKNRASRRRRARK